MKRAGDSKENQPHSIRVEIKKILLLTVGLFAVLCAFDLPPIFVPVAMLVMTGIR
ncbi:MAG: hypothetical protein ACK5MN_05520 [Lachnospiraceae bacterium]